MNDKNKYPKFFIPVHDNFLNISFVRENSEDSVYKLVKIKYNDGTWCKDISDKQSLLSDPTYFKQISIEEAALL